MKNRFYLFFASIFLLVFFSYFKKNNFENNRLKKESSIFFKEKNKQGLFVKSRSYSPKEQSLALKHEYKETAIIELYLENSSFYSYRLSAASVPFSLLRGSDLAWKESRKALPRSIGWRIASLFFWPAMIPSTIDTIYSFKKHRSISLEVERKTLQKEEEVVLPYSTVTRLLFVRKTDLCKDFSFSIYCMETGELELFRVQVNP